MTSGLGRRLHPLRKTRHTDEPIAFALRPLCPRTRIACGPVFGGKVTDTNTAVVVGDGVSAVVGVDVAAGDGSEPGALGYDPVVEVRAIAPVDGCGVCVERAGVVERCRIQRNDFAFVRADCGGRVDSYLY